jgi:spore coat polysaccharide biosynthesis predicted glycosyltransferase SpsG/CMP-N-acetylneuraminic acid synthetase
MKDDLRVIFVVPARGGDHEVPYLNIKKLGPHPLIAHTLYEATKSKYIDRLIVSTDDEQVKRVATKYGADVPFLRPPELARDLADIKAVILHAVSFVERQEGVVFDVVVTLQATSPFRVARQIDEAIDKLIADDLDSVISLKELRSLTWKMEDGRLSPVFAEAGRREELEPLYQEDGAIRVMRRSVLDDSQRLGARIGHVLMDKMSALTVHDIYDFWLAERLAHLPRVLFRVDGGAAMGMGHVYRSLTAAEALAKISPTADICFLMRADLPEGVQHVSSAGRAVRVLAHEGGNVLSAIRDYAPNIIVNDLPFLDDEYLRSLATLGATTVNLVDSLADIEKPEEMAAIIIAAMSEEQGDLDDYHAGPAFAILRDSFRKRVETLGDVSPEGRRVVLSFGGSDPQKLTLKALVALGPLVGALSDLGITAVLGPAFGHEPELEALLPTLGYAPRILRRVEHMADILFEADLVLCAGGMTVFEIAALGRPGLVLTQNAKEEARMKKFAQYGSIVHLGLGTEVDEAAIREKTRALLTDREARGKMSEAGARLVDAHGATRVAEVMEQARGRGPANGGRRP